MHFRHSNRSFEFSALYIGPPNSTLLPLFYSQTGCSLASNIVPQYCNFDRQIALSKFASDANKFTTQILIGLLAKRKPIWSLPFSYSPITGFVYKSFVNYNLQFVRVACKLLRAISLSKLQYCGTILQCCSQENTRFDCN
jgi:hypothetical protein